MSRYVDALHRSPFLWESIRWHNPALRVRVRTRSRVQQIRTAIKVELNIMQTRERALLVQLGSNRLPHTGKAVNDLNAFDAQSARNALAVCRPD